MMTHLSFSWRLVLLVLGLLVCLNNAFPVAGPGTRTLSRRVDPQPPNGTIELHHDPETSSWYLQVSLNTANYSWTSGSRTILGKTNPASTVTLYFTVPEVSTDGRYYAYEILSTPVAYEHHIDDPLTDLYVYNMQNDCTPDVQCFPDFLDINGNTTTPTGEYNLGSGGPGTFGGWTHLYDFSVDLNNVVNITGLSYDSETYLDVTPTFHTFFPSATSTST